METYLVLRALQNAIIYVGIIYVGKDTPIIFHSDQGSQYASKMYRRSLEGVEIIPSMIRKGNCYDHAYVESFFITLKNEYISRIKTKIYTLEDMRKIIFHYIDTWYNIDRIHTSIQGMSPKEYTRHHHSSHILNNDHPATSTERTTIKGGYVASTESQINQKARAPLSMPSP